MIDTIEIVLHEVNEKIVDLNSPSGSRFKNSFNQLLYDRLCEHENKYLLRQKDFVHETVIENPDGTTYKRKSTPKDFVYSRREGGIVDTGKNVEIFFRPVKGSIITPSSDYRMQFWVTENYDAIRFRFSVPKYLYNHNIAQFVPNYASERFKNAPFSMREWSGQIKEIRKRIIEIIYTFFDDLTVMLNLESIANFDMRNVEIKSIDLCYNQIHTSKENVMDYLHAQKKIFSMRVKSNTQTYDTTDSSLYYRHSNDGFYFKIYHKGAEFEANDMQRLFKENETFFENFKTNLYSQNPDGSKKLVRSGDLMQKAKEIFKLHFPETEKKLKGKTEDLILKYYKTYLPTKENEAYCYAIDKIMKWKLKFLHTEANKILRYEINFTRTYISTLFKREVFRKSDKNWKDLKKAHDLIKRYDLLISQGRTEQAKIFSKRYLLNKEIRSKYEVYHRSLNLKHEFYLQTSEKVQRHETYFVDYHKNNYRSISELKQASFSDELFKVLYKRFLDEIEFFQVKNPQETTTILEQIDDYNKKTQIRINNYKRVFGDIAFSKLTTAQKRNKDLKLIRKTRLKIVLDKLEQGESIDQIAKTLGMSKSTKYELIKELEKFNIHKQTVKHKFDFRLLKTNFSTYYERFLIQPNYAQNLFLNPMLIDFDTIRKPYH
jgi:hypothetical protein